MEQRPDPIETLVVGDRTTTEQVDAELARHTASFSLVCADTAAAALDRLDNDHDNGSIDCVVSVYDLPDDDGIELLRSVRSRYPDLPFVLRTDAGRDAVASEAVSAGVTDYVRAGVDEGRSLAERLVTHVEKAAERRRERRCSEAIESTKEGISVLDGDGRFVYVNEAYASLYEYSRQELLGEHWELLHPEGYIERMKETVLPALEPGEDWRGETTGRRADGTTFTEDHILSRTASGDLICSVRDISASKEREVALRTFRGAVEQAGHAVLITDPDGTIEYVNPAFEADTGYSRKEVVGRTPSILKSGKHDDSFYAALWETILDGELWEAELINRKRSGELYRVRQTIAPITDSSGEITQFVGIEAEITDEWLRRQRLDVLNRVLRHNVRNWMTVAKGNASLLQEHLDDERLRSYAADIETKADDLLRVSEKAATVRALFESDTDPESTRAVSTLFADLRREFNEQYPDAEISVGGADDLVVRADDRLKVALREAVDNAIVHNSREPAVVSISATADDADTAGDWVEIDIADNGPGIPAHEREAIESGKETPLVHATGLGLWLVYWVVAAFGGEVRFAENDPRGSVVTLRLPARNPDFTAGA